MLEVKPRFDGQGSDFGLIHRDLPQECTMFDVDLMQSEIKMPFVINDQDSNFFEYRTNFADSSVRFVAYFELKFIMTKYVLDALNCRIGTASWAQRMMCKKLDCRYFMVVQTGGQLPYTFFEITDEGYKEVGILNNKEDIIIFWRNILKLI